MNLSKPKINALLALALFTFVFLAAEFRFDINVGLLTGAERVVIAQGFILGASVIGFIGYAPLLGLAQRKGHSLAAVNAAVHIVIVGLTQIQFPTAPLVLEILGCVGFFGLGLLGAAAHHAFSLAFQDDPKLATGAGAAYAAGILIQFAINLLNCGGIAELIVLGAATIAISALSVVPQKAAESSNSAINPFIEPSHALAKQACWSIALVMILACLFSTLDNVVTLSNAHGTIAVQTWPRLFLAASGLAAGLIFDLAERRYMGLVMLGIAVLSTISILAVEAGADPNLGLVVFYLSSGFFVTFFTATFTQLAPRMHAPALWAGMGRAANNVCAFTTSGISLALVTSGNVALIMIGALVLLVAACAAFVAAGLFRLPQTEQEREREQLAEEALAAPHHRGATPGLHRQPRSHPARSRRAHSCNPRRAPAQADCQGARHLDAHGPASPELHLPKDRHANARWSHQGLPLGLKQKPPQRPPLRWFERSRRPLCQFVSVCNR